MTLQEKCELLKKGLENLEYKHRLNTYFVCNRIDEDNIAKILLDDDYELREKPKEAKEIFVNVYKNGDIFIRNDRKFTFRRNPDIIKTFKGVECSSTDFNTSNDYRLVTFACGDYYLSYNKKSVFRKCKYSGNALGSKYYLLELLYEAEQEKQYPCRECGVPRTKAEGGTVFTVCDDCWDKLHNTPEIPNSVLKDYLPPEKPEIDPDKPKEIFVNVFQNETIKVYDKFFDSRFWDDGQKLIKRFKCVKCSELNHTNQWYMEIGTENIRIFKNSKVQYSTGNRNNKNYGIYILELIYELDEEKTYPCRECGVPRTKAEGGTVFTVCDDCWDKLHNTPEKPKIDPDKPKEVFTEEQRDYINKQIHVWRERFELKTEKPKKIEMLDLNTVEFTNERMFEDKINELTETVNKLMEEK